MASTLPHSSTPSSRKARRILSVGWTRWKTARWARRPAGIASSSRRRKSKVGPASCGMPLARKTCSGG
eukprot:scaffold103294_cov45-Phaeocystis_antarctica.AAC.1